MFMIKKIISLVVMSVFLFICNVFGHPGRTDSKGGLWDHSTNTYHYHRNGKTVVDKSKKKESAKKVSKKKKSTKSKKKVTTKSKKKESTKAKKKKSTKTKKKKSTKDKKK